MEKPVFILNGPNLNLLGEREPHIYGAETLADIRIACEREAITLGLTLRFHQSNREYELIDWIHEARTAASGVIINPAAFTHTSIALLDALYACNCPVVEVHLSNIHKRENFRHHSYVSQRANALILGCGGQGYLFALQRVAELLKS